MKINKKKTLIAIVLLLAIIVSVYYICIPEISISEKNIRLDLYDYEVTDDDIEFFNNTTEDDWEGMGERPIGSKLDNTYINGKLFTITYKVHFDRKTKRNKYKVSAKYEIDEQLEKTLISKMIFPEDPFDVEEGSEGIFIVSFTGVKPDYDKDKLIKLIRKTKITLYAQDKSNAKIKKFNVDFLDMDVDVKNYNKDFSTIFDTLRE